MAKKVPTDSKVTEMKEPMAMVRNTTRKTKLKYANFNRVLTMTMSSLEAQDANRNYTERLAADQDNAEFLAANQDNAEFLAANQSNTEALDSIALSFSRKRFRLLDIFID